MTTFTSASLSEHLEHTAHMVGPLNVCLGLNLAILTGSHTHCDSNAHCSPGSQDLALTSNE